MRADLQGQSGGCLMSVPLVADKEYWAKYARKIADGLGLRGWRIALSDNASPEDCYAQAIWHDDHTMTVLALSAEWETLDPTQQRLTIVHEMIHVTQTRLTAIVANEVHGALGNAAGGMVWGAYKRETEMQADSLSEALAQHFPLPSPPATDAVATTTPTTLTPAVSHTTIGFGPPMKAA
jgi:hypothetical protein